MNGERITLINETKITYEKILFNHAKYFTKLSNAITTTTTTITATITTTITIATTAIDTEQKKCIDNVLPIMWGKCCIARDMTA